MAYTAYPTGATYSVTATADASAHTKGTYVEIVASTASNVSRLWVLCTGGSANSYYLADIAEGAAASESDIINDVFVHMGTDSSGTYAGCAAWTPYDVDIASGTRLSVRCQSSTGGSNIGFAFILEDRALGTLTDPATYGTVAASSRGTQIDPGGTADTKGSWTEITASTSAEIDALAVMFGLGTSGETLAANQTWKVDIGTGGAGAETVVIPDITVRGTVGIDAAHPAVVRFPVSIAASTRIAARCQCSVNTAADRLLAVTIIGMQEPAATGGAHTSVFCG